jgi:hypothetical protein
VQLPERDGRPSLLLGTTCKFGKLPMASVLSAVVLPPASQYDACAVVTGMPSGQLYVWVARQVPLTSTSTHSAHKLILRRSRGHTRSYNCVS